jgi:hypothetical protein
MFQLNKILVLTGKIGKNGFRILYGSLYLYNRSLSTFIFALSQYYLFMSFVSGSVRARNDGCIQRQIYI